ncbi:MAG: hypothetical protein K9K30_03025 [Burkholderiaceae bacterium]|nr:hypothetical protein [Sulfuritalea sp.]MCF8174190.1 hypothetical protein [Burkholderiaceae bacterium]
MPRATIPASLENWHSSGIGRKLLPGTTDRIAFRNADLTKDSNMNENQSFLAIDGRVAGHGLRH